MRSIVEKVVGHLILAMCLLSEQAATAAPQPHFEPDAVVAALQLSPDGRWLAVHGEYDKSYYFTQLWGMQGEAAGERVQVAGGGAPFAFSADSKLFATTHTPRGMSISREGEAPPGPKVIVYDVTGRMNTRPRHILKSREAPEVLFFAGAKLVGVDRYGEARVWDVESGLLEKTEDWGTRYVAFHAGRNLLALVGPSCIGLRDAATRRVLSERPLEHAEIEAVSFSPDGETLAVASRGDTLRGEAVLTLYDARTLAERLRFENTQLAGWLPDGRFVTRRDGSAALRLASGALERVLGAGIGSVHASPDRRLLLDVSGGVVVFRDPATWAAAAYWLPVAVANTARPLIATPGGLFDGDPGTWKSLSWQLGADPDDLAPAERFARDWLRPGLLSEVVEGRVPTVSKCLEDLDRRPPRVELGLAGPRPMFSSRTIELAIRVTQAPAGSQDVRLLRNGVLIKRWHGAVAAGARLTAQVAVLPDENVFSAYAFNRDNVKSPDATFRYEAVLPPRRETATIIAFGVNVYRDPRLQLRYAAPDAEAFAAQLQRALERTGHWDEVRAVTLLDAQVTRASILGALHRLAATETSQADGALTPIQRARASDTVYLFFAGHGTTLGERFYLIPHEVSASNAEIPRTAVSDLDLEAALEPLDAQQIVLIVDSCDSGQMLEGEESRQGPLNARGLAHLAYEKGMYVLVAAQARQEALEDSRFGHGLLTYALIEEGLGEAAAEADTDPQDGVVRLPEWLEHATARVPQLHAELVSSIVRGTEIVPDVSTQQAQAWTLQRPRLSYRRDLEPAGPPIVDLGRNRGSP